MECAGTQKHPLGQFLPFFLNSWSLSIAMRLSAAPQSLKFGFKDESGEEIGWFNLQAVPEAGTVPLTGTASPFLQHLPQAWTIVFLQLPEQPAILVQKSGRYFVVLKADEEHEEIIGEFYCHLVEPAPLTPEREAAIKSNPNATRAVRAIFGCSACSAKCQVYAALERMPSLEAEGFTWYRDIPEQFVCGCGKTRIDLSTLKRNFFALLGQPQTVSGDISYVRLYEKSGLENLRVEFVNLVNGDPPEESIQQFIEKNPILLHQFPSERLFLKPQILTRFKADFGVVTPQKELVLIEIERASTRLLRNDGGQHADLTHAIDQVRRWLHEANEHRQALLDSLEIQREMVSRVRGVVIAGRDAGNDASQLRRLKGSDLAHV
jgi:Domain of unknown function (DUF4263)